MKACSSCGCELYLEYGPCAGTGMLAALALAERSLARIVKDHPILDAMLPMSSERGKALDAVRAALASAVRE